jgi:hypothetical protein
MPEYLSEISEGLVTNAFVVKSTTPQDKSYYLIPSIAKSSRTKWWAWPTAIRERLVALRGSSIINNSHMRAAFTA